MICLTLRLLVGGTLSREGYNCRLTLLVEYWAAKRVEWQNYLTSSTDQCPQPAISATAVFLFHPSTHRCRTRSECATCSSVPPSRAFATRPSLPRGKGNISAPCSLSVLSVIDGRCRLKVGTAWSRGEGFDTNGQRASCFALAALSFDGMIVACSCRETSCLWVTGAERAAKIAVLVVMISSPVSRPAVGSEQSQDCNCVH